MSIFQCSKCGAIENTATSRGGYTVAVMTKQIPDVSNSYREVLGLKPDEKLAEYCCLCSPVWFTETGAYGVGKNPKPKKWHDRFPRQFLPKGKYETAPNGNLRDKETKGELNPVDLSNTEYPD